MNTNLRQRDNRLLTTKAHGVNETLNRYEEKLAKCNNVTTAWKFPVNELKSLLIIIKSMLH